MCLRVIGEVVQVISTTPIIWGKTLTPPPSFGAHRELRDSSLFPLYRAPPKIGMAVRSRIEHRAGRCIPINRQIMRVANRHRAMDNRCRVGLGSERGITNKAVRPAPIMRGQCANAWDHIPENRCHPRQDLRQPLWRFPINHNKIVSPAPRRRPQRRENHVGWS